MTHLVYTSWTHLVDRYTFENSFLLYLFPEAFRPFFLPPVGEKIFVSVPLDLAAERWSKWQSILRHRFELGLVTKRFCLDFSTIHYRVPRSMQNHSYFSSYICNESLKVFYRISWLRASSSSFRAIPFSKF